jgi:hypothetical protein
MWRGRAAWSLPRQALGSARVPGPHQWPGDPIKKKPGSDESPICRGGPQWRVSRPGNPRPGESGPRFPIPDSRPNRESGIPCVPIPGQIGNRGFPGDSLPDSRPNRESGERELGISGSRGDRGPPPPPIRRIGAPDSGAGPSPSESPICQHRGPPRAPAPIPHRSGPPAKGAGESRETQRTRNLAP